MPVKSIIYQKVERKLLECVSVFTDALLLSEMMKGEKEKIWGGWQYENIWVIMQENKAEEG